MTARHEDVALPPELTEQILWYLWSSGETDTLKSCASVCHQFLAIVRSYRFSSLRLTDRKRIQDLGYLLDNSPVLTHSIQKLVLLDSSPKPQGGEGSWTTTGEDLPGILTRLPSLKRLSARCHHARQWEDLSAPLRAALFHLFHQSSLQSVGLMGFRGVPRDLFVSASFKSLGLCYCTFQELHDHCESRSTDIQRLDIGALYMMPESIESSTDFLFHPYSPINTSELRELSLTINKIGSHLRLNDLLAKCRESLEVLRIETAFFQNSTFNDFTLNSLPRLKKLYFGGSLPLSTSSPLLHISALAAFISTISSPQTLELLTLQLKHIRTMSWIARVKSWKPLDAALTALIRQMPKRGRVQVLWETGHDLQLLKQYFVEASGTGRLVFDDFRDVDWIKSEIHT